MAFFSQRKSKRSDSAESFRRMVAGASDCASRLFLQAFPPRDEMRPRHFSKFRRSLDADKTHELPDVASIGALSVLVGKVGKPIEFGWNFRESIEFRFGEEAGFRPGDGWGGDENLVHNDRTFPNSR